MYSKSRSNSNFGMCISVFVCNSKAVQKIGIGKLEALGTASIEKYFFSRMNSLVTFEESVSGENVDCLIIFLVEVLLCNNTYI